MSRPFVELIAAVGPRWELGYQGGMPWGRIKGDMALFRSVTQGKAVIMGRRTWESLPEQHRPLKGRLNMILTRDASWVAAQPEMAWVLYPGHGEWYENRDPNTVRAAIGQARSSIWDKSGVVIIGGGEVYRAALEADLVDVIHLSVIPRAEDERSPAAVWPHDVLFPALNPRGWALTPNGSSPRFAERREPEEGAPHGWRYAQLVRNPLEPALRPDSDGVPRFWGGVGWWC